MINAVFKRNYFRNIILLICLLFGLFLIRFYIFLWHNKSELNIAYLSIGISFGIIISAVSSIFLFYNFKAYFYIEGEVVKGKFHFFRKINCCISDIDFVLSQVNTLIIQLKNGKNYTIGGLENSRELCSAIRRRIDFDATKQPDKLIEDLNQLQAYKKKGIIYVSVGVALMFVNIFVTVLLTKGKELYEFNQIDWIIMSIMGVIEIATVFVTLYIAQKTGKNNIPLEKIKYTIRRTIIETSSLSYNTIKVFADDDYTRRFILCQYPNDTSGYYYVQEFASDYTLVNVYKSDIYEDIECNTSGFEALIDITEKSQVS